MTNEELAERIDTLTGMVEEVQKSMDEARSHIATIKETVGPAIDALSSHPMFKMFLGGGKKK